MAAKKIYLAGPMTGLPDYNYPAFNAEAARLRELGYHVENPAENPKAESWQDYMRAAVAQLVKCDAVALLPGWQGSKGARIENNLAIDLAIKSRPCHEYKELAADPECWFCTGVGTWDHQPCPVCMALPV